MWNKDLDRSNRKARREAMRHNGDQRDGWQKVKHRYAPKFEPLNLGIKAFKREHRGHSKLVAAFKQAQRHKASL